MMEYERLTVRHPNSDYIAITETKQLPDSEQSRKVLHRLAEFEDDLESGKIVRLPCKVGDTVYYVLDYGSVKGECVCVEKGKVRAIEMRENYIWIEVLYDDFTSKHPLRNIGETVFLTREEAKKRLLELQGEKNERDFVQREKSKQG